MGLDFSYLQSRGTVNVHPMRNTSMENLVVQ